MTAGKFSVARKLGLVALHSYARVNLVAEADELRGLLSSRMKTVYV